MADRRNEKIPRPHGTMVHGNTQHWLEYCAGGDTTCMVPDQSVIFRAPQRRSHQEDEAIHLKKTCRQSFRALNECPPPKKR